MTQPERFVCVFCGSKSGDSLSYTAAAKAFGHLLAERGIGLVYGGGGIGLMGAIADAVLEKGGHVVGVIPKDLFEEERVHEKVTQLVATEGMHERKMEMTRRADAFAVLPGGFGTLDETFEALTWKAIGIHDKPIGILDVDGFYRPLQILEEQLRVAGFVDDDKHYWEVRSDPADLLDVLVANMGDGGPKTLRGEKKAPDHKP
jgi:uncharacterized protein (TIGR00730 family)